MSVEISLNTPLADALNSVIQPKLMEVGWAQSNDDAALSEYIILMLVNGKTQEQIAAELAGDLLSLGPDDPAARDFTYWLFEQITILQSQLHGNAAVESNASEHTSQDNGVPMEQDTEMRTVTDVPELNAPTGPRSMRDGSMRGGREKRLFGHIAKAMDRSHDSVLHRVRANGNERINTHNRAPPTGPRGGRGNNRVMGGRNAPMATRLNQMATSMPGMPGPPGMNGINGMNGMNDMSWMMQGGPQQEQIFQLLQQQNQMMAQLQQQLVQQNQGNNGRHGRSLFDRIQNPRGGRRGGHLGNGARAQQQGDTAKPASNNAEGEDVDMSQARPEPSNPESTMCKYNLSCTNKDCKFAHQSPAAPPNTTVDVTDVCSFGAACKNWKCVGRHPSPAIKRAHQNEQECKFYPNCTNPHCPFKHPEMPPCRNGGDCNVEGCKFTHIKTMCKFKPCKNRYCPFKHEEGQRGIFPDKVWTADGPKNHVSDRRYVDPNGSEEFIIPVTDENAAQDAAHASLESLLCIRAMISRLPEGIFGGRIGSVYKNAYHSGPRMAARRPASLCPRCSSTRYVSALSRSPKRIQSWIGQAELCMNLSVFSKVRQQAYATTSNPRQIAVLGAGITGLTAAHYLARYAENAHITIYEAGDKPGGWIKADRIEVEDEEGRRGHVWFQHGPRVLRSGSTSTKYDDLVLYDVLATLGLDHKIQHPQAVSGTRYLYYPDHLVKLPSGELSLGNIFGAIRSFLTEPLWSGSIRAVFNYMVSRYRRPDQNTLDKLPEDESVAQFLKRIMKDDRIVNNMVSGMMHGIYGGNVNKLSAKHTILDQLWYQFRRKLPDSKHSWVHAKEKYLLYDMLSGPQRLKVAELAEGAIHCKLLAFEDGLLSLVNGLVRDLESKNNVTFKYGEPVTSLKHENNKIMVTTAKVTQPTRYDHVISTLFSKKLAEITEPRKSLPALEETQAVTMMVVNLWYPKTDLLSVGGFGYLIPSSTPGNDECVLGVLFDSDLRTGKEDGSEMPGTKLTVMLGGHYWDGRKHLPSEEKGIAMAKAVVARHLGISETEKVVARAQLCRECLPQHFVGHRSRMKQAHYELMSTFNGHLTVAGPSYTTVGVMPAMRAGYNAGMRVACGHEQPWFRIPRISDQPEKGAVPEVDYWLEELTEHKDEKVTNIVGASGLEQFTESEWANLHPTPRRDLLFREFTKRRR
ncbi:hypothetical protein GGS21DRAFT_540436 [Xylaria nigripes]|nr:hypothetical protein GGS21DRAFT_540436 [Xylaria nigripes]